MLLFTRLAAVEVIHGAQEPCIAALIVFQRRACFFPLDLRAVDIHANQM
jgi:hypothetical protein